MYYFIFIHLFVKILFRCDIIYPFWRLINCEWSDISNLYLKKGGIKIENRHFDEIDICNFICILVAFSLFFLLFFDHLVVSYHTMLRAGRR